MDYKETLLLPKTNFPMRANLQEKEKQAFKSYYENKIYEKMQSLRKDKELFILHDGPPYANGHLHIGHAFNKILKDMIIKLHFFKGKNISFIPGWDCHGLPIEQQVELKLGAKKNELSKEKIRQICKEHAQKFVDIQKKEFKSLGVIADWDEPYLTMDYDFEADIYAALCEVAKKGLLIERNKPVFWSWAAKSALAEAEVEYEEKQDHSIYVAFELDENSKQKLGVKKAAAVIWTTTPWTLVANVAIALKPDTCYVLTAEDLIFAKELLPAMIEEGLSKGELKKEFSSNELANLKAINPLNQRLSVLLLANHVSMDGGSGLVHTAPGHGVDDYFLCLKHDLPVLMSVDEKGCYDLSLKSLGLLPKEVVDDFVGLHIFDANEKILKLLGSALLKHSLFTHSYPFCWRTHKPVIFRATKQFFISMDEKKLNGFSLRELALKELDNIDFYPKIARKRLESMIANRPDWCISRQRDWGVPIAFLRDKNTKELLLDEELLKNIEKSFRLKGASAWWSEDIASFLPQKLKARDLEKVYDILDVWFDSGSTFKALLPSILKKDENIQANMYLEGSDQHRGWFQSSLLISCILQGKSPYKKLFTHGFSVDSKGMKMSKSKGNVISPDYIAKKYGFEVFRLCILLSDVSSDLKLSDDILKQVSEQYRKIRNTIRFLLANTNDFKGFEELSYCIYDRWILGLANDTFNKFEKACEEYDFAKAFSLLISFLSSSLSGIYLDIVKDSLYCDDINDARRKSCVQTMAKILKKLLNLLAPFLSLSVDEALTHINQNIIKVKDVYELEDEEFDFKEGYNNELLMKARELFFNKIDLLKKDKLLKSTLELELFTDNKELLEYDFSDFFTVSKIKLLHSKQKNPLASFTLDNYNFVILKASKNKCPRCWRFLATKENTLCKRCQKVIENVS